MKLYCRESILSSGGRQLCEDRILVSSTLAAVIDGATQVVPDAPLPSPSEGTWISDLTVRTLIELENSYSDTHSILRQISRRIDSELKVQNWPDIRVPPVCSIATALISGSHLDVAILGDVSLVYLREGRAVRLFNDKFLSDENKASSKKGQMIQQNRETQIQGIITHRKEYINGINGAGVLSNNEAVVDVAVQAKISLKPGDLFLLATDGFMRLIDAYNLVQSNDDLFDNAVRPGGLGNLLGRLRHFESSRDESSGTYKASDDAAALILEITN